VARRASAWRRARDLTPARTSQSRIAWSRTFDAPLELHSDDRTQVTRPDSAVDFWQGEVLPLWDDLTLVRCGGRFAGEQVLH
jgi:hypothetical protein